MAFGTYIQPEIEVELLEFYGNNAHEFEALGLLEAQGHLKNDGAFIVVNTVLGPELMKSGDYLMKKDGRFTKCSSGILKNLKLVE